MLITKIFNILRLFLFIIKKIPIIVIRNMNNFLLKIIIIIFSFIRKNEFLKF